MYVHRSLAQCTWQLWRRALRLGLMTARSKGSIQVCLFPRSLFVFILTELIFPLLSDGKQQLRGGGQVLPDLGWPGQALPQHGAHRVQGGLDDQPPGCRAVLRCASRSFWSQPGCGNIEVIESLKHEGIYKSCLRVRNGLDFSEHFKAEETLQGDAEGDFSTFSLIRGKYLHFKDMIWLLRNL